MTGYMYATYGIAIAVVVIILMMIHDTYCDIKAAKQVKNGRLAVAHVRMVREVMLFLVAVALVVKVPSDIRRFVVMLFIFMLALTEVYQRKAIRYGEGMPPTVVRLFDLLFGPRE
jgi:hypothetical protein